jgi:hypothetical protein
MNSWTLRLLKHLIFLSRSFEMQKADRDKLLIREKRLRQRDQDDLNDYVTVLHDCWDALEGFGIMFSKEQQVTKFYINLQPDIKDFVVSQRVVLQRVAKCNQP